jgi:N-methylhydantoinase B
VRGGKAGMPFQVVIDPGGPDEREVDALADAEEIKAGQLVRIRTTGGGGWGDPLARDPRSVVRDVVWGKVSAEAALRDYGVVLTGSRDAGDLSFDEPATTGERASRVAWSREDDPFFDRGPGYASLADGASSAEADRI